MVVVVPPPPPRREDGESKKDVDSILPLFLSSSPTPVMRCASTSKRWGSTFAKRSSAADATMVVGSIDDDIGFILYTCIISRSEINIPASHQ